MAPSLEKVRKKIDGKYEKIQDLNYYEILGVDPEQVEEDDAVATKHFKKLAKRWHADRFKQYDLGEETQQKLRQIFAKINKAHDVLTDTEQRDEYNARLRGNREENLEEVIDSEQAFLRGKNILETGNYEAAAEHFKRALDANPDAGQYQAYYLYTKFLSLPKDRQGRLRDPEGKKAQKIREKLSELEDDYDEHDWIFHFRGVVAQGFGNWDDAKDYFRRARDINSDNRDARRRLRLLAMREENQNDDSMGLDKLEDWYQKAVDYFKDRFG